MENKGAKNSLLPILEEIETVGRLVSEKERRKNQRLSKRMKKLRQHIMSIMDGLRISSQLRFAGVT